MVPAVLYFVDYISSLHKIKQHIGDRFFVHIFLKKAGFFFFFPKNEQEWQKPFHTF